ncbi:MAG: type II secretion system F family protein [Pseudomonadota bacterium]
MAAYDYTALSDSGRTVRGLIEAESDRQARRLVRERGYIPLSIDLSKKKDSSEHSSPFGFRMRDDALALFTQTLATLLQAGMPVDDAMQAIINQTDDRNAKSMLVDVRAKIAEGYSFEQSLAEFPRVFSDVYCATVGAGEQTRHLPIVLQRLADHVQRAAELKQRIRLAMVYPALLILVSVLVVGGLLVYVVPDVVAVFAQSGNALPRITVALITISDIARDFGLFILLALTIIYISVRLALRNYTVRFNVHQFLLRMPFVGDFLARSDFARFSRTLSVLLENGVEMLDALDISGKAIGNVALKQQTLEARDGVREGESLSRALHRIDKMPKLVSQLIASGETSGELPKMLEASGTALDHEIAAKLAVMLSLIEPLLILVMGGIVFFIVIAILLPIFDMNTLI